MKRLIFVILLILTVLSILVAAEPGRRRLAVLELANKAELTDDEAGYLTDKVRDAASRSLAEQVFLIITRESMEELLPPDVNLAECSDASCEVEIGRKVGADYIISGEIIRFSGEYRLNLKAHQCLSGAFLGSEAVPGKNLMALEDGIGQVSTRLFSQVSRDAGLEASPAAVNPAPVEPAPVTATQAETITVDDEADKTVEAADPPEEIANKPKRTQNNGRYRKKECGCILDRKTGLEWIVGPDKPTTSQQAEKWIKNLSKCGKGWRMPTSKEVKTLYTVHAGARHLDPIFHTSGWIIWTYKDAVLVEVIWCYDLREGIVPTLGCGEV